MKTPAFLASCVLLSTALMSACSSDEIAAPSERLPVVRAYLYADEPVTDVRLTWTTTLDAADSVPLPINDAQVVLVRNGIRYALIPSPGDSGYYHYAGGGLVVREGDVFDLEAKIGALSLAARTQVPVRPTGARLSSATLILPTFSFTPGGPRPDLSTASLTVYWVRQSDALYYVAVESTEPSPTPIDTGTRFVFAGRRLAFSPTSADSFRVDGFALKYYGRHRVRVYRVNEEYAQLYATQQQDSRDLNEPVTNIAGGLGVFSAFASDTAFFVAVAQ